MTEAEAEAEAKAKARVRRRSLPGAGIDVIDGDTKLRMSRLGRARGVRPKPFGAPNLRTARDESA